MQLSLRLLLGLALPILSSPAVAEDLVLSLSTTLDVQAVPMTSVGDLAVNPSTGTLWVCDGSTNGRVFRLNGASGALLSDFDPAVIPGLNLGPDALAIQDSPTAHLFVFSSFGESEAGRASMSGTLINDFGGSHEATGADMDSAGNLWIVSGTAVGGGSSLERLDTTTGAVLATVPIVGTTARTVDVTFDPHTGACYCLGEDGILREVNTLTGAVLSGTDLNSFLLAPGVVTGGLDFDPSGEKLYVATGSAAAADSILVLARDFSRTICDGTDPFVPCPCGNVGLDGHGCPNSLAASGALLDSQGTPDVSHDDLVLFVSGLPPSTSCLFYQGTSTPESNPFVFGDGLQCVSGSVIRLGTKTTTTGGASYPVAGDLSISVRGAIPTSGATRFYQAWYRDVTSFCTPDGFNFTNAVKIVWAP